MRSCLKIVLVQTLLFNARDVQSTISDIHLSMVQPCAGLVARFPGFVRAAGLNTIFAKVAAAASYCLDSYRTRAERDAERVRHIAGLTHRKPVKMGVIAKIVEQSVSKRLAGLKPRQIVKLRKQLDRFVEFARQELQSKNNLFVITPSTVLSTTGSDGLRHEVNIQSTLATAARYNGLGPVSCAAVSITRFVQSCSYLCNEFDKAAARYEATSTLIEIDGHLHGFDKTKLPPGTKTDIKMLLDAYRRVVLQDAAHRSKSSTSTEIERFDNMGVPEISEVIRWLSWLGAREINDFEGDINSERRTFHLLDVLPEVRLSR